jgi:hypothetical protein
MEQFIELPRVETLAAFLEEAEVDFFTLLLSWEVEWLRVVLLVALPAFLII